MIHTKIQCSTNIGFRNLSVDFFNLPIYITIIYSTIKTIVDILSLELIYPHYNLADNFIGSTMLKAIFKLYICLANCTLLICATNNANALRGIHFKAYAFEV